MNKVLVVAISTKTQKAFYAGWKGQGEGCFMVDPEFIQKLWDEYGPFIWRKVG